ncbi:hypothetical protein HDU97_008614 [Phlyctochytrium planicorne]|nr:hypothetical protein HDU97_008614 [Phlyctochytrium planicorne]
MDPPPSPPTASASLDAQSPISRTPRIATPPIIYTGNAGSINNPDGGPVATVGSPSASSPALRAAALAYTSHLYSLPTSPSLRRSVSPMPHNVDISSALRALEGYGHHRSLSSQQQQQQQQQQPHVEREPLSSTSSSSASSPTAFGWFETDHSSASPSATTLAAGGNLQPNPARPITPNPTFFHSTAIATPTPSSTAQSFQMFMQQTQQRHRRSHSRASSIGSHHEGRPSEAYNSDPYFYRSSSSTASSRSASVDSRFSVPSSPTSPGPLTSRRMSIRYNHLRSRSFSSVFEAPSMEDLQAAFQMHGSQGYFIATPHGRRGGSMSSVGSVDGHGSIPESPSMARSLSGGRSSQHLSTATGSAMARSESPLGEREVTGGLESELEKAIVGWPTRRTDTSNSVEDSNSASSVDKRTDSAIMSLKVESPSTPKPQSILGGSFPPVETISSPLPIVGSRPLPLNLNLNKDLLLKKGSRDSTHSMGSPSIISSSSSGTEDEADEIEEGTPVPHHTVLHYKPTAVDAVPVSTTLLERAIAPFGFGYKEGDRVDEVMEREQGGSVRAAPVVAIGGKNAEDGTKDEVKKRRRRRRKRETIGPYVVVKTLGTGSFSKVKLAYMPAAAKAKAGDGAEGGEINGRRSVQHCNEPKEGTPEIANEKSPEKEESEVPGCEDAYEYHDPTQEEPGPAPADMVAIKMISKTPSTLSSRKKQILDSELETEISIMSSVHHPMVVGLKEVMESPEAVCLVQEFVEGGELFLLIAERFQLLSPRLVARIFGELVEVVAFLHDMKICHRDLKIENVLLTSHCPITNSSSATEAPYISAIPRPKPANEPSALPDIHIKLTDFGLAVRLPPEVDSDPTLALQTQRCGSEEYAAPEVIMAQPYDPRLTDVWSLGVILFALVTGELPFSVEVNQRPRSMYHKIARGQFTFPKASLDRMEEMEGGNDDIDKKGLRLAKELIEKILVTSPGRRLTAKQILEHPFLKMEWG